MLEIYLFFYAGIANHEFTAGENPMIYIQLMSFMDDFAIFFNKCQEIICSTKLITSLHPIVGIPAIPIRSAFIATYCKDIDPIPI
jgi:hypothetical protein